MIKTDNRNLASQLQFSRGASPAQALHNGNRGVVGVDSIPRKSDGASVSREARAPEASGGRLSSLLQGLNGWNSNSSAATKPGSEPTASSKGRGGWDEVMKSGQMPISIIKQVAQALNVGGMATAGALHSLLSWGAAEKQKTGEIREEFQTILRDAIEFGKKNKVMSEEDLAKYEQSLFADGGSQKGAGSKGKGSKVLGGLAGVLGKKATT